MISKTSKTFKTLWFSIFRFHAYWNFCVCKTIDTTNDWNHWFIEHDQLRTFVFQMIDQLVQRRDNVFARESIETSIVCIVILIFWVEIDNLTLLHAFCMMIVLHAFCIIIEMIVQIWKICFLHWFFWFSQRQWNQTV